ncbi:MAG: SIMPL domain-containing protein [Gemmatimonadaceae bacterium]|nr:SIMPL domain-containing protein [Gemmatimonadaceae bacterium]
MRAKLPNVVFRIVAASAPLHIPMWRRAVWVVGLVLAAGVGAPGQAAGQSGAGDVAQIVVSAQGDVKVTPDQAMAVFAVETRRATAAVAGTENARTTRSVIDAIRSAGVPAEDITTLDYSVYPEQQWDAKDRVSKVVGYVVRNSVRVRIAKLERTPAVIDAALAKGANSISSLDLTSSTMGTARREALANAVEQAKADAELMAKAAGGQLGALIELSTQDFAVPVFESPKLMRAMAAGDSAPTPVMGGSQTLSARVSARWRFIPFPR